MPAMRRGVNYPWRHYGGDFGTTVWGADTGVRRHAAQIAVDFAAIAAAGVDVVRWFVFTDGRGGLDIGGDGWPRGVQPDAWADLDELFTLALDAQLSVVPVLFDHTLAFDAHHAAGARLGGRAAWLADPDGQARVVDTIVTPLAARYGAGGVRADLGRAVHAWDLLNEPDWIVGELHPGPRVATPIPFDVLGRWVREAVATIRRHDAGAVTIGNARLRFAHVWDAPAFDLDFLQAHVYYDPHHDLDLLDTPYAALGLTRPLVLGECSARGEGPDEPRGRPALRVSELAAAGAALGYAGAWPWSWRGVDGHGGLAESELSALRATHDERRG